MNTIPFRVIDPVETGKNILRLRKERGLSIQDIQAFFGFEEPQAVYKWQKGKSLPSVDNLYALSALLSVSMEDILVQRHPVQNIINIEQQADTACCSIYYHGRMGHPPGKIRQQFKITLTIFLGGNVMQKLQSIPLWDNCNGSLALNQLCGGVMGIGVGALQRVGVKRIGRK